MRSQFVQVLHKLTILKNIIKKSIIGEKCDNSKQFTRNYCIECIYNALLLVDK